MMTVGLLELERRLKKELADVLMQEEMLWMQNLVLISSGLETKIQKYHISTLIQRRRNRVETLTREDGRWVNDREELRNMALSYYADLFRASIGGTSYQVHFPTSRQPYGRRWRNKSQ